MTEIVHWEELYHLDEKRELDAFGKKAYSTFGRWISPLDTRVLDAGFGSGRLCFALARDRAGTKVTGIDISEALVDQASQATAALGLDNLEFKQADIFQLPFENGDFDVVFNEGVIEHFPNYPQALAEMVRVVKPGGTVIVGVPNLFCLPHTIIKKLMGEKYLHGFEISFTHRRLKTLFEEHGLKNLEIDGYYPMWSLKRYQGQPIFSGSLKTAPLRLASRFAEPIERLFVRPMDLLSNNAISRRFGYEIVIKGQKVA